MTHFFTAALIAALCFILSGVLLAHRQRRRESDSRRGRERRLWLEYTAGVERSQQEWTRQRG